MGCLEILIAFSMHLSMDGDYNAVHPHARCTVDDTIFGVYYNSLNDLSFYAAKEIKFGYSWDQRIELGFVSGYSSSAVTPIVRYKVENFFISPSYETISGENNYGLVVGFEFKL
jgi:hypothetical protein